MRGRVTGRAWLYDFYLAGLIVLTFVADQASKTWVRNNLLLGESLPPTGFFRFTHTYNTGSAFGLFPGQTFLLMLASLIGIGILLLYFKNQSISPFWLRTSLGLQLGGAAGNLVDRITLGRVTDFIDVGRWPVFNLADSSIMTGIAILAWFVWRSPKEQAKPKEIASLPPEATPPAAQTATPDESPAGMPIPTVASESRLVGTATQDSPQEPLGERHG